MIHLIEMMINECMRYLEYVVNSHSELASHTIDFDLTFKQIDGDKETCVQS
jgi:hypothetical protein